MTTRAIVFATVAAARNARNRIDTHLGYPKPGKNLATGQDVAPGTDGWTITEVEIVRVVDVNGIYSTPGSTWFFVGPISPALETKILQLANPPTIVNVPDAIWRKGRRFVQRITGWANNLPVATETTEDYDADGVP